MCSRSREERIETHRLTINYNVSSSYVERCTIRLLTTSDGIVGEFLSRVKASLLSQWPIM